MAKYKTGLIVFLFLAIVITLYPPVQKIEYSYRHSEVKTVQVEYYKPIFLLNGQSEVYDGDILEERIAITKIFFNYLLAFLVSALIQVVLLQKSITKKSIN